MSELLTELLEIAPRHGINTRSKEIPTQPNVLARRLNGIKSNLEAAGIIFTKHGSMRGSHIIITNVSTSPLAPYIHNPGKLNNLPYGDKMDITSGHGDDRNLPPYAKSTLANGFGNQGDNGGDATTLTDDDEVMPDF